MARVRERIDVLYRTPRNLTGHGVMEGNYAIACKTIMSNYGENNPQDVTLVLECVGGDRLAVINIPSRHRLDFTNPKVGLLKAVPRFPDYCGLLCEHLVSHAVNGHCRDDACVVCLEVDYPFWNHHYAVKDLVRENYGRLWAIPQLHSHRTVALEVNDLCKAMDGAEHWFLTGIPLLEYHRSVRAYLQIQEMCEELKRYYYGMIHLTHWFYELTIETIMFVDKKRGPPTSTLLDPTFQNILNTYFYLLNEPRYSGSNNIVRWVVLEFIKMLVAFLGRYCSGSVPDNPEALKIEAVVLLNRMMAHINCLTNMMCGASILYNFNCLCSPITWGRYEQLRAALSSICEELPYPKWEGYLRRSLYKCVQLCPAISSGGTLKEAIAETNVSPRLDEYCAFFKGPRMADEYETELLNDILKDKKYLDYLLNHSHVKLVV
ncbi:protein TE17 [Testudinid alphaherpesvirus 3]|uniref:Protein TE17 n=1 Tax=Testudinid alphaherpesvirus 3 TaxID=2560801 RepID=A0A0K1R1G1_9ALPH|nr:protein TE17 [Testudinid alphaherpesvirus 3]AIU39330.1 protein TE17 [Testudinid alphaherpesvirus 3]AIU39425.1 protein TE17 [Testudinid alphaherpesvirus 3]AKI81700.1 protein TE17 [Testudinid alphaherpesvirus 3]AKV40733.1 hypothetical protein [Testudinid alphaherpesvirus 3]